MTSIDAELFNTNLNTFLENKIKGYVVNSPDNRLEAFNNDAIFDEPLVGFADGSCRRCIERCPGDGIDEQGHDKNKCSAAMRNANDLAEQMGCKSAMVGRYDSCGLCMTKVPCEHMIPPR